jgi:hypothetical protein
MDKVGKGRAGTETGTQRDERKINEERTRVCKKIAAILLPLL